METILRICWCPLSNCQNNKHKLQYLVGPGDQTEVSHACIASIWLSTPSPHTHFFKNSSGVHHLLGEGGKTLPWDKGLPCTENHSLCWDIEGPVLIPFVERGCWEALDHSMASNEFCTYCYNHCKYLYAFVVSCPENTVSLKSSTAAGSYNLPATYFASIPELWRRCMI